jgi:hypothetical protein
MDYVLDIKIKKCKNGFYIRIYDGFWQCIPKRFVAKDDAELTAIISEFVRNFEKLEKEA